MTIYDQENLFSDNQVVTATAVSTNVIDLGPLTGGFGTNTKRDIGVGQNMWIVFTITEAFTDASSDSTVTATLETDDNEAFSSAVVLRTFPVFAALTPIGTKRNFRLDPAEYERFIRLNYTVAGGSLSTGKIHAGLVIDSENRRDYASGFQSSV